MLTAYFDMLPELPLGELLVSVPPVDDPVVPPVDPPVVPVPPALLVAPVAESVLPGVPLMPLVLPLAAVLSVAPEVVVELEALAGAVVLGGNVVVVSSFLLHAAVDTASAMPSVIRSCLRIMCSSCDVGKCWSWRKLDSAVQHACRWRSRGE